MVVIVTLNVRIVGNIKAAYSHIFEDTIVHLDTTVLLSDKFVTIIGVAVIAVPHKFEPVNVGLEHLKVRDWAVSDISFIYLSETTFA